jgi:D-arginine dehydrogenase
VDPLPQRAEIAIVGGGLAGAATAWWLARRDVPDVVVLEREDLLGMHASGRNAGMCRQIADDDRWTALCARGARFLRRPPEGFARRPVLAMTGSLLLADDAATLDALAARARDHEIEHRHLDPAAIAALVPAAAGLPTAGAIHTLTDGIIDTTTLLHGFAGGARRAGARLVIGAEVLDLHERGGAVEVVTARGTLQARLVVCAAGAWAGPVAARAGARDVDFSPIKRHLSFLAQDRDGPAVGDPFVWRVGPAEVYVRNGDDGLIASACDGVRSAPGDLAVDPQAIERLAGRLAAAPRLATRTITATWACQRTFSPEGHPRLGRDRELPWLFWAAGLGGHGATASAAAGEDAAAALIRALAERS